MRAQLQLWKPLLKSTERRMAMSSMSAAGNATRHVLHKSHIPTTPLQKVLVAFGATVAVFSNPKRGDMLAALGDATGEAALRNMHLRMYSDPIGMQILNEKPRMRSNTIDVDRLRHLPEDSFGNAYMKFMDAHGFEADGRSEVRFVDDPELAYVMLRYRECHDFYHTLFDLPPTEFAEIILKYIELVQTGLPVCTLSGFIGPLRLTSAQRTQLLTTYIPWAYRAGHQAQFLLNVYFEKEFETPLEELRQRLGIQLPPKLVL